ncbi:hypothetical protein BZG36_05763, partial [Bifiguratus adelaidae]
DMNWNHSLGRWQKTRLTKRRHIPNLMNLMALLSIKVPQLYRHHLKQPPDNLTIPMAAIACQPKGQSTRLALRFVVIVAYRVRWKGWPASVKG